MGEIKMWTNSRVTCFYVSKCQVAGGTDFIQKVLDGFGVPSVKSVFMVDMNAYDGFAAMSTIEDPWKRVLVSSDLNHFTNPKTHSYSK